VQKDQEGDAGRRAGAARSHRGGRRALAWASLVVVGLVGLGAAAPGLSASGAQAAGRHAFLTPSAALLVTPLTPPAPRGPGAPGTPVTGGADQSDPFLTVAAGRYLLVTSGGTGPLADNVPVATSTDFVHWTDPVDALPGLPTWAQRGFTWAPDLHRFGSHYALYFTAMVKDYAPQTQCIGSAFATSPTGPFTAQPLPIICQLDQGGSIDPRVFVNSDGTPWVLWKSDQNIGGASTPTKMWSQRLSADGTTLLGSPSFLMSPDEPWQGSIVEAPDMVELHGTYWVVYSANWYNHPEYGIGAARCAGPAGPCQDVTPDPLLATNLQGEGPGEASVFHDDAGFWMLYSPWRSLAPQPDIPPRPVYITRLDFGPFGPFVAAGPLPGAADLLGRPLWSPTP
jgi:hypothetical protein